MTAGEQSPERALVGVGEQARRGGWLGVATAAFRATLADPNLRRAQLAFGVIVAAQWAFTVALSVVAFRQGGTAAVGVVLMICTLPAALLGPFGAVLADRLPRERVLIGAGSLQALATGCAALALGVEAGAIVVYGLAIVTAVTFTAVRPAHSALLPSLCKTPQQLTSATVVRGLMDSVGTLVGPVVAAGGLAVGGPAAVFAVIAAGTAWSALLITLVRYERPPRNVRPRRRIAREAVEGFAALGRYKDVALITGIALAQTFTRGCVNVLVVIVAIELLANGEAGVGVLSGAIGAGAVVGSLAAALLARSHALARWEGVGVALWGLPLLGIAALPYDVAALAFLAAVGVGNALVDVGLFTLPARMVPDVLLGRVFGIFESLISLTVALGALAAPLAVHAFGVRGALAVVGLLCPLCVLAAWPRLRRIDRAIIVRDDEIALLRGVAMLRALPLPAIEQLAAGVKRAVVSSGTTVFDEGDDGDAFYVIASGEAEVYKGGRALRVLSRGDGFGEIALLRKCARTATVRARGDLHLDTIVRNDFLAAITGYRPAAHEADREIDRLLHHDAAGSETAMHLPRTVR